MRIAVAGGTGLMGSAVVDEATARGHEIRVIARSAGVDAVSGTGLEGALDGVDVVVDVLNIATVNEATARELFLTTTANLLAAEAAAGVGHHLALSIVGVDRAPHGYYGAKLAQERAVAAGTVPWTIQRATQFHDFAAQMYRSNAFGRVHPVIRMRTQPVALTEVAARLVDLAEQGPAERAPDLAGPREEELGAMVRAWAEHTGRRAWTPRIPLPGGLGRAMRDGSLLPGPDADLGHVTFQDWLARQPRAS
ncbi:uncharacterized protein YbjT (DUF2867 family) [Microbacterium resistens]|uniref:Uncharacterized protein YbjT (DUF2867 family) n=1 Tax=Microbacterium resistens TaxID=156977 RepID=A0ABU1SGB9_9MICO|nr:SDR family oxidoreductase [Microbacterium resistens]MDR6868651.1 uncharacterized protein YbjT (DUF2867 family) [Microbacterium resistens]